MWMIVGTQWEKVTFSVRISFRSMGGSYLPG